MIRVFFFFNDTATTEIYTLSLHDALPIWNSPSTHLGEQAFPVRLQSSRSLTISSNVLSTLSRVLGTVGSVTGQPTAVGGDEDRKSTRLNSSHANISYAVFCLKKKITHTCS